jgi:cell division protein FtsZ
VTAIAGGRAGRAVPTLEDLNVPTYIRNQRDQPQSARRAVGDGIALSDDSSLLDIPAFLRRQAD